mmetsp:Transcript_30968/g.60495  ORF Transcript_30968/g.60495 Transcript_30968/m.60495 type:complete len:446 (-) Transcript_30968:186-1523(-)
MNPPKYPTGKHLRWLLLLAVIAYTIYFIASTVINEPPESRAIYICDTSAIDNYDGETMIQCLGLDDVATCSNIDGNGQAISCIESSCGYKLFPHIDISIAGSSDPFDDSSATPVATFSSVCSIFYSLVPYLLGYYYLVAFLLGGRAVELTRLLILVVIAVVNEGVFKNILKENRPEGSCLYFKSYGMPSGHAATSIGLLTYLLLEIFVYHPNVMCGLSCQERVTPENHTSGEGTAERSLGNNNPDNTGNIDNDINNSVNGYTFQWGRGWYRPRNNLDVNGGGVASGDFSGDYLDAGDVENLVPSNHRTAAGDGDGKFEDNDNVQSRALGGSSDDGLSNVNAAAKEAASVPSSSASSLKHYLSLPFQEKYLQHWYALVYFALLFPVPFSRVYLHDHYRSQVLIGSVVGMVSSLVWYLGFVRGCIGIGLWRRVGACCGEKWLVWWRG